MPDFRDVSPPLPVPLLRAVEAHFDADDAVCIARAPGRVNLLGDHTDYNDGFVLPTTIDRAVYAALRPRRNRTIRLHAVNFEEEVTYPLTAPPFDELPGWGRYVAGVTEEVRSRHGMPTGFEGILYGDVPLGAGLSSSAALEVATALALDGLFALDLDAVATARLCQRVEHTYVGVQCGIMDQMAARLGRAGHALFLDCRSLDHRHIPLPLEDASLVIADSRVQRELAASKYNERRAECDEAVRFFRHYDDRVDALRDVSEAMLDEHGTALPEPLFRRAGHVVSENRRVQRGSDLLAAGRLEAFGALMDASHASLRDDYEVSVPELDRLVEIAQDTDGVLGARMTGAGFGGCVVCLVHNDAVPPLQHRLRTHYPQQFDREPALYVVAQNLEATVLEKIRE